MSKGDRNKLLVMQGTKQGCNRGWKFMFQHLVGFLAKSLTTTTTALCWNNYSRYHLVVLYNHHDFKWENYHIGMNYVRFWQELFNLNTQSKTHRQIFPSCRQLSSVLCLSMSVWWKHSLSFWHDFHLSFVTDQKYKPPTDKL